MQKLAILTNQITPYRLFAYGRFGDAYETLILHGGREKNRTWELDIPQSLKAHKVLTIQLPMHKKAGNTNVSDIRYLHFNFGLLWWLPRFRPDVIISHEMGMRTIIAILHARLAPVPLWVWWGGTTHTERHTDDLRRAVRRMIVRRVSRWISYGTTSTEYLESIGVRRGQILQIQNCVRQETFQVVPSPSTRWFEGLPRPVLLSVGQLVDRKGLDKLIEDRQQRDWTSYLSNASGLAHSIPLPNIHRNS